ncbi:MAG: hypothetical protein EA374_07600 [Acholeplasmatales bacterium]|nr:MAG: hypothetical protein EA374_07600 [Acholeplasmatales bacterium]
MLKRLYVLCLMQLSNKMDLKLARSKRFLARVALRALVIVLMTIVMTMVLHVIGNILYIPVNNYFIIFVLLITQGISIAAATNGLMTDLYKSRDNQILHALPVNNDEIFLSKLIVYSLNEFMKNLYVLIPLLFAFGFVNQLHPVYYVNMIPMVIILPLLSVGFAALLSMPLSMFRNFLSDKNILTFILTVVLIGVLFGLTVTLVNRIPTPIRIVQLYNRFIIQLTLIMQSSASYGLIYTVIGHMLFGINIVVNYLIVLATLLGLALTVMGFSKPLYFKLASQSQEFAVKKIHVKSNRREKSLFMTFLRKEWIIAKRSVNQLISDYALLIALPFFMVVLNTIYMGMNRSTTGNQLVIIFNVFIVLLLVTASNTASASAITTEGSEFILLKAAPSDTRWMAWAKIAFNLIFSSLVLTFSFLLFTLVLPVFPTVDIWLLYGLVIILNSAHIFWSFQIDLLNPRLSDYAMTGSLSGNPNIRESISSGFVISLLFGAISALLFFTMRPLAWPVLYMLALIFAVFRLYFFRSFLRTYFIDIEY